jgi:hypothetical protein
MEATIEPINARRLALGAGAKVPVEQLEQAPDSKNRRPVHLPL